MSRAKRIWEDYGVNDAYYAVATIEKYRKSKIDDRAKDEFFETGREHVRKISGAIEKGFGVTFSPSRGLDYGCGVGRILIPLAEKCESVVGVDISTAMLDETRKNCAERNLTNVELKTSADFAQADSERYDFVHSYIVLQHIDPSVGYDIITKMLARLDKDGIGMLQVTFSNSMSRLARLRMQIYRDIPFVHDTVSRLRGRKEPQIPMYQYDLNRIFQLLHESGCDESFVRFSDHGMVGAMIFFRKTGPVEF